MASLAAGTEAFRMEDLSDLKATFDINGFAVVKNVFSSLEIEEMRERVKEIVSAMNAEEHPQCVFTTYNDQKHAADMYFLESSDRIRFFYEENAFNKMGQLIVPKEVALNKVGHALHWLDDVFKKYTFSTTIKKIVSLLHFEEPEVVQSMYIFKQPKIGGAVNDHIDATFLYVEPSDHLLGMWIAIDDADLSNGCLSFIPGSHKAETISYRFKRTHAIEGPLLRFEGEKPVYNQSDYVSVPVEKGSIVLIHGCVAHKSEANVSTQARHAYTFHVIESKGTTYSEDNWLQQTGTYSFPKLFDN